MGIRRECHDFSSLAANGTRRSSSVRDAAMRTGIHTLETISGSRKLNLIPPRGEDRVRSGNKVRRSDESEFAIKRSDVAPGRVTVKIGFH